MGVAFLWQNGGREGLPPVALWRRVIAGVWIPACAGMTEEESGNDGRAAGMTFLRGGDGGEGRARGWSSRGTRDGSLPPQGRRRDILRWRGDEVWALFLSDEVR